MNTKIVENCKTILQHQPFHERRATRVMNSQKNYSLPSSKPSRAYLFTIIGLLQKMILFIAPNSSNIYKRRERKREEEESVTSMETEAETKGERVRAHGYTLCVGAWNWRGRGVAKTCDEKKCVKENAGRRWWKKMENRLFFIL